MNLKDSFRYQNFLEDIINKTKWQLENQSNVTTRSEEHQRKKSNPDAENETVNVTPDRLFPNITINSLIGFYEQAVSEKIKLTVAIDKAKKQLNDLSYDAGLAINRIRQGFANTMRFLAGIRPSESITQTKGYKFNVNGDQVPYFYDVKTVVSIDFDRNHVRSLFKKYTDEANATSDVLDHALLDAQVDFEPLFDMNNTFEETVERYFEGE